MSSFRDLFLSVFRTPFRKERFPSTVGARELVHPILFPEFVYRRTPDGAWDGVVVLSEALGLEVPIATLSEEGKRCVKTASLHERTSTVQDGPWRIVLDNPELDALATACAQRGWALAWVCRHGTVPADAEKTCREAKMDDLADALREGPAALDAWNEALLSQLCTE
jgi:hypothetical protein